MRQTKYDKPIHQALAVISITLAMLAAAAAFFTVRLIVLAIFLGIGIGVLVAPIGAFFKDRYKIPKVVTHLLILILGFGGLLLVGYLIGQMISDQIVPVVHKLPSLFNRLEARFGAMAGKNFDLEKYFGGAAQAIVAGLRVGASAMGGLVFIFFVAFYISMKPESYLDGFLTAFPAHLRDKSRIVLVDSAQSLRRWFLAQLTAMVLVGVLASALLAIVGSHYWMFFGVITAVLELVPYFGPITAFLIVCIITLAADPSSALKTVIAFSAVLALEGNVIVPLVMKNRIELPPVHLLIFMAVMGEWFGVIGFLMAAPTLAVVRTIYLKAYVPKMDAETRAPRDIPDSHAAASA